MNYNCENFEEVDAKQREAIRNIEMNAVDTWD